MAQRPLVGYDHPEEADESDTEEHLDIDDDDDFGVDGSKRSSESNNRGSGSDFEKRKVGSTGDSTFSATHAVGVLRPAGSLVSYVGEEESEEEDSGSETDPSITKSAEIPTAQEDGSPLVDILPPKSMESPRSEVDDIKQDHMTRNTSRVQLPPEPEGRCSRKLQEKIARMLEKKERGKLSLNEHVQRKKDFRNPSIYEKLVLFCSIDETGTNYPKKYFDPSGWGPDSYYDALAKVQKEAHDKREREKKNRTQVDFVTATKKNALPIAVVSAPAVDDKLKKSKWDKPAEVPKPIPVVTGPIPKPTVVSDIPAKKPKLAS